MISYFYKLTPIFVAVSMAVGYSESENNDKMSGRNDSGSSISSQDFFSDTLFVAGVTPRLISDQFKFTEGPAANKKGDVYFTDQPTDIIWKYSTAEELTIFMEKAGRANGLYFDNKGNLISCSDENNELWCISPKKKVTILVKDYKGQRLNGPNDVWVHPNGDMYFTDPHYDRPWWPEGLSFIQKQNVYFLPKGKSQPQIADSNLVQPNGIIGSADGKLLYVADIRDGKTYRYDIANDGKLLNRQLFTAKGSDGMTIDSKGNIYLTGDGVTVFNPAGQQIAHIKVPAKWTANVCFGGIANNQLFITASEGFYVMPMIVTGARRK